MRNLEAERFTRDLGDFFSIQKGTRGLQVDMMLGRLVIDHLADDLRVAIEEGARGEHNSTVYRMDRDGLFLVFNQAEDGIKGEWVGITYGIFNPDHSAYPALPAFARLSGRYAVVMQTFGHVKQMLGGIKEVMVA